ncbi:MFS transporter, partial [Mycobacterium asiaticum]|uniref:MFS transporter n=1 Tax=Mycobacterium asiaticum TaxID=1790 RepID=UPI001FD4DA87
MSTPTLRTSSETTRLLFAGVLATLLAMGWAASHFTALMPALGAGKHLSAATLDLIFGVYAIGLLPGLLVGGRASDTFGRASVALVGSLTVLLGTVAMLPSQESGVLMVGRLIVGLGVGLAVSSCTSWASDLHGSTGAARCDTPTATIIATATRPAATANDNRTPDCAIEAIAPEANGPTAKPAINTAPARAAPVEPCRSEAHDVHELTARPTPRP